jgi:hypothetical protein
MKYKHDNTDDGKGYYRYGHRDPEQFIGFRCPCSEASGRL